MGRHEIHPPVEQIKRRLNPGEEKFARLTRDESAVADLSNCRQKNEN
jgi:hypothetical protein